MRAAVLVLLAGCTATDVIAVGGTGDDAPAYCQGDGPPILVGDGITVGEADGSSDDVCTGEVAVRTFRHALCTCEGYATATSLTTDSFDSAAGPYTPGGTAGPVAVNAALQTNDALAIGGALTVGAAAVLGADLDVAGACAIGGGLGTGVAVTVGGDARIAGDLDLASLDVAGVLTVPDTASLGAGTTTADTIVRAPVTVEPACACAPDDLVDIAGFVDGHRADHDDAAIGLEPDDLAGYAGDVALTLPCGRYFLDDIHGTGALTLVVTGRVAVLVAADLVMQAPLTIELAGDDAELDLMIAGLLASNSAIVAGDPDHPARTRIYVGGDGEIQMSGDSQLAANLYAPRAGVSMSGGATVFGSLFVRRLVQSAPVVIHYDVDVLRADAGC